MPTSHADAFLSLFFLIGGRARYLPNGVVENREQRRQIFDHTLRTPRKVDHHGLSSNPGRSPGQHGRPHFFQALRPHGFPDTGDFFLNDVSRGFRGPIRGPHSGPAYCENYPEPLFLATTQQMLANHLPVIMYNFIPDKTEVVVFQISTKTFLSPIVRFSGTDLTADDQNRNVNHVTGRQGTPT